MKKYDIGVYFIKNNKNSKIYVGASMNLIVRMNQHRRMLINKCHFKSTLQKDWDKCGADNFTFGIFERVSESKLIEREQFWINRCQSISRGYNSLVINLGNIPNPKTRKKQSNSKLGVKVSAIVKKKISKTMKGYIKSEEHRRRLSKAGMGHVLSNETRKKISETLKRRNAAIRNQNKIIKFYKRAV